MVKGSGPFSILSYVSAFVPVPHCLDFDSFVIEPEVWNRMTRALFFFFKVVLAIWGLLWFHTHFRTVPAP